MENAAVPGFKRGPRSRCRRRPTDRGPSPLQSQTLARDCSPSPQPQPRTGSQSPVPERTVCGLALAPQRRLPFSQPMLRCISERLRQCRALSPNSKPEAHGSAGSFGPHVSSASPQPNDLTACLIPHAATGLLASAESHVAPGSSRHRNTTDVRPLTGSRATQQVRPRHQGVGGPRHVVPLQPGRPAQLRESVKRVPPTVSSKAKRGSCTLTI